MTPVSKAIVRVVAATFAAAFAVVAAAAAHEVDQHHLPVGDGKYSTGPKKGYIWVCRIDPQAGGAQKKGPWFNGDGATYDRTAKAVVPGNISWKYKLSIELRGERRAFSTNDLPNHGTGKYPIDRGSDAYKYDRNPNSIARQDMLFDLPSNPTLGNASCTPGAVGILLSGAVLFNALDAPGRDANAWETQDKCQGHPQESGIYHYHSVSTCVDAKALPDGHSALVGYALDGFGIYGRKGEGGKELSSDDLDECHGHTHTIEWDGKQVEMYHYHATWDFPYTIGCLRGAYQREIVRTISGPPPQRRGGRG